MQRIQSLQPDRRWASLALLIVNDRAMIQYNETCFAKSEPTDVISLAYDPLPGEEEDGASGEVIVNLDCALREGPRHGGASRELAFYIVHGCHHLAGATDDTEAERAAMHAQALRWLKEAEAEGLLAPGRLVTEVPAPRTP